MLQETNVRHFPCAGSTASEIGKQEPERCQNDQHQSQREALDYKSHVAPTEKGSNMGVESTTAKCAMSVVEIKAFSSIDDPMVYCAASQLWDPLRTERTTVRALAFCPSGLNNHIFEASGISVQHLAPVFADYDSVRVPI